MHRCSAAAPQPQRKYMVLQDLLQHCEELLHLCAVPAFLVASSRA